MVEQSKSFLKAQFYQLGQNSEGVSPVKANGLEAISIASNAIAIPVARGTEKTREQSFPKQRLKLLLDIQAIPRRFPRHPNAISRGL